MNRERIFWALALIIVLLFGCSRATGPRMGDTRIILPMPPGCPNTLPGVVFHPCGNSVCLDVDMATALIVREGEWQACAEAWRQWVAYVCSRPQILCRSSTAGGSAWVPPWEKHGRAQGQRPPLNPSP